MKWSFVFLVLAITATSITAADPPAWKEFVSKEGKFKVLMPGTPKESEAETESDFGKGVLHMNSLAASGMMFAANYSDFPTEVKKVPLKQIYDSSRDGAVANMEGKLAKEKDIKLGDHPGREVLIDVAGGKRLFRARVYLVGQRLYQVVVFGTKEAATSKDADKFLDSFKLMDEK
jgi:hypothetical protein